MKTLYYNGKIYLQKGKFASSLLTEDEYIKEIDCYEKLKDTDIEKVDLQGRTMLPGLHDSHLHLLSLGNVLEIVKLNGITTISGIIEQGRKYLQTHTIKPTDVLTGRGWNHDYFTDEKRFLTSEDLDKISTEIPIIFTRVCGHIVVANSKAMEIAGIDENTKAIEGGAIYHYENGKPNGLFSENSITQINCIIKERTTDDIIRKFKTGIQYAISKGLTSVGSNDIESLTPNDQEYLKVIEALEQLYSNPEGLIRMNCQATFFDTDTYSQYLANNHKTGSGNYMLKYGPLKMYIDGSLGARTALLSKPYNDDNSTCGVASLTDKALQDMVNTADKNNCSVIIHSIGDLGTDKVLTAYENVIKNGLNKNRHSVNHVQITDQSQLDRFVKSDILAAVQPIFIDYDMNIVRDRVGDDLAETSYNFGYLYKHNVHVSYGTDCPIEDLNPFENIYCAVTRQNLKGDKVYLEDQTVSVEDAIDMYTYESAYSTFEENIKGRIKEGYLADMVVIDKDIFTIDSNEIKNIKPLMTIIGGKVLYKA